MADFCKQCSIEIFNKDFEDLAGLGHGIANLAEEYTVQTICEGCGETTVDKRGVCISKTCLKQHGLKPYGT